MYSIFIITVSHPPLIDFSRQNRLILFSSIYVIFGPFWGCFGFVQPPFFHEKATADMP